MRASLALVGLSLVLAGCVDDKADPLAPTFGEDGKGDVSERVTMRGELTLGNDVTGELTEDLEFHGYTLRVGPGSRVLLDVTHTGSSAKLDSSLFVYGPQDASGGYGTDALYFDDDSGWGRLSRLTTHDLAAGKYLVVVGTHDGRGRGRYRLTGTCKSGECGPLVGSIGECIPEIAADIRACVTDLMADPDNAPASELEAVELCSDAEPVADAYDDVCASSPRPGFCDLSYEEFSSWFLPACVRQLKNEVLTRGCVFGSTYHEIYSADGVHLLRKTKLTSVAGLSDMTRQQIVLAVQASSHTDVTTAEEALARVDQEEINQVELWDATNRRGFTVYEYGAGDNSYGRLFAAGTTTTVAKIHDGDLEGCDVHHGPEGLLCQDHFNCESGMRCVGVPEETNMGRCVNLAADDQPAASTSCTAQASGDSCPLDSGLLCAGLTRASAGMCLPAWMRGRFVAAPGTLPIPDVGSASSRIVVSGLATVDMDVSVQATIYHAKTKQLRVTLTNPVGTEVVVFDGSTDGVDLYLDAPVRGFSGDESVNGSWLLKVTDVAKGAEGTLADWSLVVGSRWD